MLVLLRLLLAHILPRQGVTYFHLTKIVAYSYQWYLAVELSSWEIGFSAQAHGQENALNCPLLRPSAEVLSDPRVLHPRSKTGILDLSKLEVSEYSNTKVTTWLNTKITAFDSVTVAVAFHRNLMCEIVAIKLVCWGWGIPDPKAAQLGQRRISFSLGRRARA